jgi:hypothetical protein
VKKLKIYLDTSVISHLDTPDTPEKMADTRRLWDAIKLGVFDAVLSNMQAKLTPQERTHDR